MVWHFWSCKNTAKIERIHKRALKFMLNDFTSDYKTLMAKANTSTLEVKRLRSMCIEVYKTANDLNAQYMKELFIPRNSTYAFRGSQNLSVPRVNQTTYGLKSIRYQGKCHFLPGGGESGTFSKIKRGDQNIFSN